MEAHPVFWFVCWMCVFASGLLFFSSFFLSFWSSPFSVSVILCSWAPGHCSSVFVLVRSCVLFVCVYVGVCVLALVCSCSFLRVLSSPSLIVCAPLFSSILCVPVCSFLLSRLHPSARVPLRARLCVFLCVCIMYVFVIVVLYGLVVLFSLSVVVCARLCPCFRSCVPSRRVCLWDFVRASVWRRTFVRVWLYSFLIACVCPCSSLFIYACVRRSFSSFFAHCLYLFVFFVFVFSAVCVGVCVCSFVLVCFHSRPRVFLCVSVAAPLGLSSPRLHPVHLGLCPCLLW